MECADVCCHGLIVVCAADVDCDQSHACGLPSDASRIILFEVPGSYTQNGSSARKSPLAAKARARHPMQTWRNSQHPHLPLRLPSSRNASKTAELFQISAKLCLRRSPASAGRYPQGKTSPSCERKQTPVPARQPLVMAFMSPGWPPLGDPG